MMGMSVKTFWDRQASSKPRQFRTEAGRSRARVIRPSASSATQANASPREDSAHPRPLPAAVGKVVVPVPAPASSRSPMRRTDSAADRKSTRLNSSHVKISYAVFCLKKKKKKEKKKIQKKKKKSK